MNLDLFRTLPRTLVRGKCVSFNDTMMITPDEKGYVRFELTDLPASLTEMKRLYMEFLCDMDGAVLVDVEFYKAGSTECDFSLQHQMIPTRRVTMDCEFYYLDSKAYFIKPLPGMLKGGCYGYPTELSDIVKITVSVHSPHCSYFNSLEVFGMEFSDEERELKIIGEPMIDPMGQWIQKDFPNKTKSVEEMVAFLRSELEAAEGGRSYPENFSHYGGCKDLPFDKTGFFHTVKKDDRWYLVDPDGYGFFSNGVNYGSRMGVHGFIDGMRNMFSWLPDEDDPVYRDAWTYAYNIPEFVKRNGREQGNRKMFNFARANMIRAFGPDKWWESWCKINSARLKSWGYNTINVGVNNYEDENVHEYLRKAEIPFVWTLKHFPLTKYRIYRDFSDVFSDEYRERAISFAKEQLAPFKKNPYMIGYFITNEPEWRFQDVNLAERVFASTDPLESRQKLISHLREKYTDISALNEAWGANYGDFDDLQHPSTGLNKKYPKASADFEEMHSMLVRQYETVVHDELKREDPDHLDLGMRYSQAGKTIMAGAPYHDLVSFNCYFQSPEKSLRGTAELIDKPIIIGEWQVGCWNNGKLVAGLLYADDIKDRGPAIANYMQDAMTDKNCVGLGYFEFNDQPLLGRFDGECMQHGLIDICNRPYQEVVDCIRETGIHMYDFTEGKREKNCYVTAITDSNGHNEMF